MKNITPILEVGGVRGEGSGIRNKYYFGFGDLSL